MLPEILIAVNQNSYLPIKLFFKNPSLGQIATRDGVISFNRANDDPNF